MSGNRLLYIGAIMAIAFETLFTFASPLVIRETIDSIIGDKLVSGWSILQSFTQFVGASTITQQTIWACALILVILSFFRGVFTYLNGRWSAKASESIARNMRDELYLHLQSVPVKFYSEWKIGDLIQRCTSDVETVRKFLSIQVVQVGKSLLMLAIIIPILVSLNAKMALVSMVTIPLILTFAVLFFLKIKSVFQVADESEGFMSAVLQENLTGIRVVRAFARQDFEMDKFDERNTAYRDNVYRLIKILGTYWGLSDLLIYSQTGLVLVVGTYWTIDGQLTLGTLVAFVSYVEFLLWPIRQTGRTLTDLGKAFVSLDRIRKILNESLEDMSGWSDETTKISGNIEFKNTGFRYDENTPVLENISFKINPGDTVVIVGPTGSGKSTLANLLPRLWNYTDGSVLIDGRELNTIGRKYIRQQIGIVLQEPFLYSKSLIDNIRLGKITNPGESEIFEASRIAAIHEEIETFEKGYETLVGERGVTLSGGQKQRIAIARAIIQDPPILIFDDSLSALDTETETRIREALISRKGKRTTIVIAHRLTTAVNADMVIVLENGQVSQSGKHEQLIRMDGLYKRLWTMQTLPVQVINDSQQSRSQN
jgi:ATP-binding cassette, subfamily B, bacterial